MIEADKRRAIFLLHQEGMPLREISRRMGLSHNTVAAIIAQKGVNPSVHAQLAKQLPLAQIQRRG